MTASEDSFERFLKECEKDGAKFKDKDEAQEAFNTLQILADLVIDLAIEDHKRKVKLRKHPDGYPIEEGEYRHCLVCDEGITSINGWYDKYGYKCLNCQRAVKEGILPTKIFGDKKCWLSEWKLKDRLGIHRGTMKKMIREGKIKPRVVTDAEGRPVYHIFMVEENNDLLTLGKA